jgi:hypothetical protein
MRMNSLHYRVLVIILVYGILKFMGGSFGALLLYPVTLFVTFLHEMGHALGALFTGGDVVGMQINANGSGFTQTRGGNIAVVLMGGYIGSAILGNILFYIGARKKAMTQFTLQALALLMLLAGVVWFQSLQSTGILIVFALVLLFIAARTNWDQQVLMFLGLAAVLYIIEDFNVGPSSDLAMYEQHVGGPAGMWMYVWLILAGGLSLWNIKQIFS